jgi:hypothetical protein
VQIRRECVKQRGVICTIFPLRNGTGDVHRTRALCLHRLPLPLPSRDHLPPCSLARGVRLTWHLAATISDEETVRWRCAGATVASACAGGWCSMCLAPHSSTYKVILWFFVPLFIRPLSSQLILCGVNRPQRVHRLWCLLNCSLSRKFLGSKQKISLLDLFLWILHLHYLKVLNLSNNSTSWVRTPCNHVCRRE